MLPPEPRRTTLDLSRHLTTQTGGPTWASFSNSCRTSSRARPLPNSPLSRASVSRGCSNPSDPCNLPRCRRTAKPHKVAPLRSVASVTPAVGSNRSSKHSAIRWASKASVRECSGRAATMAVAVPSPDPPYLRSTRDPPWAAGSRCRRCLTSRNHPPQVDSGTRNCLSPVPPWLPVPPWSIPRCLDPRYQAARFPPCPRMATPDHRAYPLSLAPLPRPNHAMAHCLASEGPARFDNPPGVRGPPHTSGSQPTRSEGPTCAHGPNLW